MLLLIKTTSSTVTGVVLVSLIDPYPSSYAGAMITMPAPVVTTPVLPIAGVSLGGGLWQISVGIPIISQWRPLNYTVQVTDSVAGVSTVAGQTAGRYVELDQWQQLVGNAGPMPKFAAKDLLTQYAILAQATRSIDIARKYQGRKYDLNQVLQFPRIAYDTSQRLQSGAYNAQPVLGPLASDLFPGGDVIWDWDNVNKWPLVPQNVQAATLLQAESIAQGTRQALIDKLHDGYKSERTGGLDVRYELDLSPAVLCQQADAIMDYYRIRQGRIM